MKVDLNLAEQANSDNKHSSATTDKPSRGRPLLRLKHIKRDFVMGMETVHALREVDLSINTGECVAIVGPSGSGKSSLLNILGLLDRPTSGVFRLAGIDTTPLDNRALTRLRNQYIGFIFQQFHLLSNLTAFDNVALPLHYAQQSHAQIDQLVKQALHAVGLAARANHKPMQLSGGERQRVAIARAIVRSPQLLLADEPTGALDTENGHRVLDLMLNLQREKGMTLVVVTHDTEIAAQLPRRISVRDGIIEQDERGKHA